jgi:hypothetical protein
VKLDRLFGVAVCVIVALGLVLAFLVIGPPSHARLVSLDQQRVRDLENIASRMHERFGDTTDSLPKVLPSDLTGRDPVTGRGYEFQIIDARHYALCAHFVLAADPERISSSLPLNWPHGPGRTCYEFNVSADDVAPRVIPAVRSRTK